MTELEGQMRWMVLRLIAFHHVPELYARANLKFRHGMLHWRRQTHDDHYDLAASSLNYQNVREWIANCSLRVNFVDGVCNLIDTFMYSPFMSIDLNENGSLAKFNRPLVKDKLWKPIYNGVFDKPCVFMRCKMIKIVRIRSAYGDVTINGIERAIKAGHYG